jgi:hypothetical protein
MPAVEDQEEDPDAVHAFMEEALEPSRTPPEAFVGAAAGLSAAQVREALERLAQLPPSPKRGEAERLLLRRWGQLDAEAALQWVSTIPEPARRNSLRQQVIQGWASVNPGQALAYLEQQLQVSGSAVRAREVFEGVQHADDATALTFFSSLDVKKYGEEAANLIWMLFGRNPDQVASFVATLPEGDLKRLAVDRVIDHWARYDPWAAKAWMERVVPPEAGASARLELGESWARVDPAGAVRWFLELPPEQQERRTLDRILYRWLAEDPGSCSEWLATQPPTPWLDSARSYRAQQIARRDPAAAMEWVHGIADPKQRERLEEQLVWEWYRRDRTATVDYVLHRSGLSESARRRILERAQKDAERAAASKP